MTEDEFLVAKASHAASAIAQHAAQLLVFGLGDIPPGLEQSNAERLESAIWDLMSAAALLAGARVLALRFDAGLMQRRFDALTSDLRCSVARGQVQGPCSLLAAPGRTATAHEVAHALAAYVDAGASGQPSAAITGADAGPTPDPDTALRDPAASTWFLRSLEAAMRRDPVDAANDAEVLARILDKHANKVLNAARGELDLRAARAGG